MAISLKEAKDIIEKMIGQSGMELTIVNILPIESDEHDGGFYAFDVRDKNTEKYYYPGELLPCINMSDGKPNDIALIPPGFENK